MAFHLRDGVHFERGTQGAVTISKRVPVMAERGIPAGHQFFITLWSLTVPENEWASVLASMSARGETADTWHEAVQFHGKAAPPPVEPDAAA